MTLHPAHDHDESSRLDCWCCGAAKSDDELVRLGNHPEVGICPRCAHWIHRRGRRIEDARHPSAAARLRSTVDAVRTAVIHQGWHQRGLLGALLRRIDRHLP